jgi:hypothetical protein
MIDDRSRYRPWYEVTALGEGMVSSVKTASIVAIGAMGDRPFKHLQIQNLAGTKSPYAIALGFLSSFFFDLRANR